MVSLKELRDALNSVDDEGELLDNIEANNSLSSEFDDPDTKVGLVFYADEEDHTKYYDVVHKLLVVQQFIDEVVSATKESIAAEKSEEFYEWLVERNRI